MATWSEYIAKRIVNFDATILDLAIETELLCKKGKFTRQEANSIYDKLNLSPETRERLLAVKDCQVTL